MASAHALTEDQSSCTCGWKPSDKLLARHGGNAFVVVAMHLALSKLSLNTDAIVDSAERFNDSLRH